MKRSLVLASASAARKELLLKSGVRDFTVSPAHIDEAAIRREMQQNSASNDEIVTSLASIKAQQVSLSQQEDVMVLGADQLLVFDKKLWGKPQSKTALKNRLQQWRGKTHLLPTACVLFLSGREIWRTVATPKMTMRNFSDEFVDNYVENIDEDTLQSVGGYCFENEGIQLFSHVEGDYSTILGLPLLPVLDMLRKWQIITS